MQLTIEGRSALVTGSSRGIGRAVARSLASEGIPVTVTSRTQQDVDEVVEELKALNEGRAIGVVGDLDSGAAVDHALGMASEEFGPVDLLVNSVGSASRGGILEVSDEQWDAAFSLKLMTAVRTIRSVLPEMKARGRGTIVNVAGLAGWQPKPHQVIVGAVNASLLNLTRALGRELAGEGIRVNAVIPGLVDTSRTERFLASQSAKSGRSIEDELSAAVSSIPAGRAARAEEIASAVLFLAAKESAHINGVALEVDGGETYGLH